MNFDANQSTSSRTRRELRGDRVEYVPKTVRPVQLEQFHPTKPPMALIIACTEHAPDSPLMTMLRPEPILLWQTDGHFVPPFGECSMEANDAIGRAVDAHGVQEIVICGHLPSGKIQQFIAGEEDKSANLSPGFARSMNLTRQIVEQKYGQLTGDRLLQAMAEESIFIQLASLRSYPSVIRGMAVGNLDLCAWLFDKRGGRIYGHETRQSRTLTRIRARTTPGQRPSPFFDPCDVYLA